ncbi:MAG: hypothetical protein WC655_15920 [Candidatus Hydrogenedentales bacterium]|jgi:hypothetical protein
MKELTWQERRDGVEKAVSLGETKAAIARAIGTDGVNLANILRRGSPNSRYVQALDNWLVENVYSRSSDSASSIAESGQVLRDSGTDLGNSIPRIAIAGARASDSGLRRLSFNLSTDDIMDGVLEAKTLGETELMNGFLELATHVRDVKSDLETAAEELDAIDNAVLNLKSKLMAVMQVRQMRSERAKPNVDANPKSKGKELDGFG